MKFNLQKAITICVIILLIIFFAMMVITVTHEVNGPHLTEGIVVDKQMYPPVGKAIYPSCVLIVEKDEVQDEWYVSENYYDGVRVGSYVKK